MNNVIKDKKKGEDALIQRILTIPTDLLYNFKRLNRKTSRWKLTESTWSFPVSGMDNYVAKAFDSIWIEGLLFKLTILEFPSYLVKLITSYLHSRTFVAAFQAATSSCRLMRAVVAQGGSNLSCTLQFVCERHSNPFPPHRTGPIC